MDNTNTINNTDTNIIKDVFVQFPYLNYINLKEKQCNQLVHIIRGSRLRNDIQFCGFYNMTMNDAKKTHKPEQYATFKYIGDSYARKSTNAIGFDIISENRNSTTFNKLFIIQHQVNKTIYYNYILIDTKNNKSISHYYKDNDFTTLLNDINVCFNRLEVSRKMNNFMHKSLTYNKHIEDLDMGMILRCL